MLASNTLQLGPRPPFSNDTAIQNGNTGLFAEREVERVKSVGCRLLGGAPVQSTASSPRSSSLLKKVWKVLIYPLSWLIQKIVAFVKWFFPSSMRKKTPSSSAGGIGKGGGVGKGSSAGNYLPSKFCLKTLDELIKDCQNETSALDRDVKDAEFFNDLKTVTPAKTVEEQVQEFSKLYSLHYEIVEASQTIEELLKDNRKQPKGQAMSGVQALELKQLQQRLNCSCQQFKGEISKNSKEICALFDQVRITVGSTKTNSRELRVTSPSAGSVKLKDRELWFLRDYYSILRLMVEYAKELTTPLEARGMDLKVSKTLFFAGTTCRLEDVVFLMNETLLIIQGKEKKLERKTALAALGGIPNITNSCYMNSCLQTIFGTALGKMLDGGEDSRNLPEENKRLAAALSSFREVYRLEDKKLRERLLKNAAFEFRRAVAGSRLAPGINERNIHRQHDAPELMGSLLDALGYQFNVQTTTSRSEKDEEPAVDRPEPARMLRIEVAEEATLQQALDRACKVGVDDPENLWRGHKTYQREYRITGAAPEVLIIQLGRMQTDDRGNRYKVDPSITWDSDTVDLKSWIDPNGEEVKYRVSGYVNHRGESAHGGHYTANVRKGESFYCCDDPSVAAVSGDQEKDDREHAYLLVLERVQA